MGEFRRLDDEVERVFDGFVDLSVMADLARLFLGRALEIFDQLVADLEVGDVPSADEGFFAAKIDFGTVTSINGRVIVVAAKKLDVPPASADLVTKALFDLKSPSAFKRKAAASSLAGVKPNERRAEVAKELAAEAPAT